MLLPQTTAGEQNGGLEDGSGDNEDVSTGVDLDTQVRAQRSATWLLVWCADVLPQAAVSVGASASHRISRAFLVCPPTILCPITRVFALLSSCTFLLCLILLMACIRLDDVGLLTEFCVNRVLSDRRPASV